MTRRRLYWMCQIGGWTAFVAYRLAASLAFTTPTWTSLASQAAVGLSGLALTHLYRALIHRWGWKQKDVWALVPRMVLAALVLAVVDHALLVLVNTRVLGMDLFAQTTPLRLFVHSTGPASMIMLAWSALYFGINFFLDYRQAELEAWKARAQAESSRLTALKLQLNPHFLFNTLNSIRALIHTRPEEAEAMVTRLSRLLRQTLRAEDTTTVPLRQELRTTRTYLDLESTRLGPRLRYEIDVPEALLERSVPFLLVQTLAENAVKHGVARVPGGGCVRIEARAQPDAAPTDGAHDDGAHDDEATSEATSGEERNEMDEEDERPLRIRVENPGRLREPERPGSRARGEGIGLSNVEERLRLLYGEAARFCIRDHGPERVRAEVVLPAAPPSTHLDLVSAPSASDLLFAPSKPQPLR